MSITLQNKIKELISQYGARDFARTLLSELEGNYCEEFFENFEFCNFCFKKENHRLCFCSDKKLYEDARHLFAD